MSWLTTIDTPQLRDIWTAKISDGEIDQRAWKDEEAAATHAASQEKGAAVIEVSDWLTRLTLDAIGKGQPGLLKKTTRDLLTAWLNRNCSRFRLRLPRPVSRIRRSRPSFRLPLLPQRRSGSSAPFHRPDQHRHWRLPTSVAYPEARQTDPERADKSCLRGVRHDPDRERQDHQSETRRGCGQGQGPRGSKGLDLHPAYVPHKPVRPPDRDQAYPSPRSQQRREGKARRRRAARSIDRELGLQRRPRLR